MANTGPPQSVAQLSYSPDGRWLAAGGSEFLKIWDWRTGRELRVLPRAGSGEFAFSADWKRITVYGSEGSRPRDSVSFVRIWNVATGSLLRRIRVPMDCVSPVELSSDGSLLATPNSVGSLDLWRVGVPGGTRRMAPHVHPGNADGRGGGWFQSTFSRDGSLLAASGDGGGVEVWNTRTGQHLRCLPQVEGMSFLSFSPRSDLLATGSSSGVELWRLADGRLTRRLTVRAGKVALRRSPSPVKGVLFSPDGSLVLGIREADAEEVQPEDARSERSSAGEHPEHRLHLWTVREGREVATFSGLQEPTQSVAFSPDGRFLAAGTWQRSIPTWNVVTRSAYRQLRAATTEPTAVAVSRDGSLLAVGDAQGNIHLWNCSSGQRICVLGGHLEQVLSVTFTPDGRRLASSSYDGALCLWEVGSGRQLYCRAGEVSPYYAEAEDDPLGAFLKRRPDPLWTVAFSPDGRLVAGAGGSEVRVWDAETGVPRFRLQGYRSAVRSVAFTPDGEYLVSTAGELGHGRAEGELRISRARNGDLVRRFWGPGGVGDSLALWDVAMPARSSAGRSPWLAARSIDEVRLWDFPSLKELQRLPTPGATGHLRALATSRAGEWLVAGDWGGQLLLWHPAIGRLLDRILAHGGILHSLAFLPDGQHLLSVGGDGSTRLWRVQRRRLRARGTLYTFADGGWAVVDTEGHYDAAHRGQTKGLYAVSGMKPVDWGPLQQRLHAPGLLARLLRGRP